MRFGYFITGICFLLWLILFSLSFDLAFWSRGILQPIANGVTYYKQYFALIWLAICYLTLSFPASAGSKAWNRSTVYACLIALMLNGLSCVELVQRFNLDWGDRVLGVSDRILSSNVVQHTHTLKGMFVPIIQLLGIDGLLDRADVGVFYYRHLPKYLFILAWIIVPLAAYLLVVALRRNESLWKPELKQAYIIIYSLAAYATIKSAVDGGPLSSEVIACLPILVILLLFPPPTKYSFLRRYLASVVCLLLIVTAFLPNFYSYGANFLYRGAGLGVFAIIGVFFLVHSIVKRSMASFCLAGIGFIFAWFVSKELFWLAELDYLQTTLGPQDEVLLQNLHGDAYPFPIIAEDGVLKLHAIPAGRFNSVWELHRKLGLTPGRRPLSIPGKTCVTESPFERTARIILVEPTKLTTLPVSPKLFSNIELQKCQPGESCHYFLKAELPGCMPDPLMTATINHLDRMGLRNFVLIFNLGQNDDDSGDSD